MNDAAARAFVAANTALSAHPLAPEVRLRLASEITPIWQATEDALEASGVAPPFWAFAWPGGVAMARHILDHPECARGRAVHDVAAGSGITAIAAALAGGRAVTAWEIDAHARAAIALNAEANGVAVATPEGDPLAGPPPGNALVLAGDVCYERALAEAIVPWLRRAAAAGSEVWLADPGRAYLPKEGLEPFAVYGVPTTRELEDRELRETTLYRLSP